MTIDELVGNQTQLLKYLKEKFVLLHHSNIFFRDLHFGVMAYLAEHGKKLAYNDAEAVARDVAGRLEQAGILKKIDHQSWLLNYPEFALPRVEKKAS
jgi:hypothetical protein